MYKPFIFQLPASRNEFITESDIEYSTSKNYAHPLFKYGFHYYMNQTKDKLSILNNPDLKGKSFYNIIETFDDNTPNYESSLSAVGKKYLEKSVSSRYLELWEILSIFRLNGNLYINDEDYDDMLKIFYNKTGLKFKSLDNFNKSDIYININDIKIDIKYLEPEHYFNIIESIIEISEGLNKGGNCIIRIYDTYTEVSIKLLKLISEMFEETYIYKPYITHGRDSTKYIIGLKHKQNFKHSKKLNEILKVITNNKGEKLNDVYYNHELSNDFVFVIKYMNIQLGNYEHKMINILVDYIKKSNYFGDVYHNALENQKKSSVFWIDTFFVKDSKDYKKSHDTLNTLIVNTIKDNNKNMIEMFKLLIQ
jgi:hypothetical protein